MSQTISPKDTKTVLLATFFVRDVFCALDAAAVQEVIRLGPVTPIRHAPGEVAGVINLRGKIITVLDLGLRLDLSPAVPGPESRIFIVEDRNEFIGLMVDRVGEVVETDSGKWQPPPANVSRAQSKFFKGVARAAGRVIAILDNGRILSEAGQ
jgi:purine-binding chemotaxis protein CheW